MPLQKAWLQRKQETLAGVMDQSKISHIGIDAVQSCVKSYAKAVSTKHIADGLETRTQMRKRNKSLWQEMI